MAFRNYDAGCKVRHLWDVPGKLATLPRTPFATRQDMTIPSRWNASETMARKETGRRSKGRRPFTSFDRGRSI